MNTQKLTKDQFAKFYFELMKEVECYQFDLFHDIAKITNDVVNTDLIRDEQQQIETREPIFKTYWLGLRTTGSYLFDMEETGIKSNIEHVKKTFSHVAEYEIKICLNADFLIISTFAEVTQLETATK